MKGSSTWPKPKAVPNIDLIWLHVPFTKDWLVDFYKKKELVTISFIHRIISLRIGYKG